MYFNLNYNKKIKCPKLSLRTSGNIGIGVLTLGEKPEFELNANDISLLKFKVYEVMDGKKVDYYDLLEIGKLVESQKLGVYKITDVNENRNGKIAYKEISAKSKEYELKTRKIFDISGVFSLYNVLDTSKSLMHIICNSLGNWSIGHVDQELTSLRRTFDVDSSDVYSLLTDSISNSFQCIFQFDTYKNQISCYTLNNFGKKVNVLLSYRNLVQNNMITSSIDKVSTVFRVRGGNNLDIRSVNPTGSNLICNFDNVMVPVSEGGNASDGLVSAWLTYKNKYASLVITQNNNVTTLKNYYSELLQLQNKVPSSLTTDWTQYGLVELNSKKTAYETLQSKLLSNDAGKPDSPQYAEYTINHNLLVAVENEIKVRESQIASKNAQITTLQNTIANVASQLSFSNNFTPAQITELYSFYRENDFIDETYVVSEDATNEETLAVQQALYTVASTELARVSLPQYDIETTLINLFNLPEFSNYQEDFKLGNIITIKFRKDYVATARLLSIKINFNKLDEISVVFANRNKLDNSTIDFAKIANQATSASNTVNVNSIGWDSAYYKSNAITDYMTNPLKTSVQEIKDTDNAEVSWGKYGLRLRELDAVTGGYHPEETWITKNKLLMSDDNFATAKTGIGKWYDETTKQSFYGFIGECVVGKLIMGDSLKIYNKSGTYTINDSGLTATAKVDINTYSVGINPSTPSEIFNIKVNGSNKFYIDTVNNRLSMTGDIHATSGNIGGWTIESNALVSPSTRMKLSGGGMSLYNTSGNYLGGIVSTSSTDSGVVLVKSSAAKYLSIATTNDLAPSDGINVNLNILYTPEDTTIGGIYYPSGFHFRLTNVYIDYGELNVGLINGISVSSFATGSNLSQLETDIKSWVTSNFVAK